MRTSRFKNLESKQSRVGNEPALFWDADLARARKNVGLKTKGNAKIEILQLPSLFQQSPKHFTSPNSS
jgi:hypothetical protein